MGYSTDFEGSFKINKKLDQETFDLINGLASTRRMKRKMDGFGVDGEFFVDGGGYAGQDHEDNVVESNCPPSTQPGLWLQWVIDEDMQTIQWDGNEKFYHYVEWMEYLIAKVLEPRGYSVSGKVFWEGEDSEDLGTIIIKDNDIDTLEGHIVTDTNMNDVIFSK